jgi:hypothetical protein
VEFAEIKGMAYSAVPESGRDYGGTNGFRPPDGYFDDGNGDLRKKMGSMEHAANVDSPNEVKELVDIIEAAENTIRSQVEETEQLRIALRAAELELQSSKNDQQKQGVLEGNSSSQLFHGRNQSFQRQPGLVQPHDYQNGSAQLNGHSNGSRYGGLKNGHQSFTKSNGALAADNGRSVSPLSYVICLEMSMLSVYSV